MTTPRIISKILKWIPPLSALFILNGCAPGLTIHPCNHPPGFHAPDKVLVTYDIKYCDSNSWRLGLEHLAESNEKAEEELRSKFPRGCVELEQ